MKKKKKAPSMTYEDKGNKGKLAGCCEYCTEFLFP
jgi:hypothetical protein